MKKPEKSISKRKAALKRGIKRTDRAKQSLKTKSARKAIVKKERDLKEFKFQEQMRLLRGGI